MSLSMRRSDPETPAVMVADTSQWYVETSDLTELEVVDVAVGQNVTILADALPDVEMQRRGGRDQPVLQIAGRGYSVHGAHQVNDVDPRMRWGMTVEVTFEPLD